MSQMWLWSQRPHVLATQAIILMAAMNLLCWALVVGAFLKVCSIYHANLNVASSVLNAYSHFILPTTLGRKTPICRQGIT